MIDVEIPSTLEAKDRAISKAFAEIEKAEGEGALIRMGDRVGKPVPCIPTGIYGVDYKVLGVGGIPRGRITEIYGPEAGGKTTISLMTIASAQRANGRAAFIDAEHALDPTWAGMLGVNVDDMLVSQPDYGEQALRITEKLLESAAFDVIVVDSVAALSPKAEIDGEIGDSIVGLQARLMSQAMRKLTPVVSRTNTALIFINQLRDKIGVTYGSPETTTGGKALKFYASVRLDVRRIGQVKKGEENIGNKVKIKGAKNKVASPFREAEIELIFGKGFDREGSLIDAAIEAKVVEKSGSWYSYKGDRLGQGKENACEALRGAGLMEQILREVREASGK